MELRHLRYFVAVAEHLSFTAAAESLGLSQPPLSQQIRDLEAEIGSELFERSSRRVALTPAGHDFLNNARAILAQARAAVDRARTVGRGSIGLLDIGLTGSVLVGPLGPVIRRFGQIYGQVELRIHELPPDAQIAALRAHRIDLSFLRSPPEEADLARERAWAEGIALALPREHPLARRSPVPLRIVGEEPFISLRLKDSRFANEVHNACIGAGFVPRIAQQVVEASSLISLVAAGLGVALVPEFMARLRPPRVVVRPTEPALLPADVFALHRTKTGPVVENFLALLRAEAPALTQQLRAEAG